MRDLKLKELARHQTKISEKDLWHQVERCRNVPEFRKCLQRLPDEPLSLIAEVKARAPGRKNVASLNPATVVRDYEAGGANAVSVLTDESRFGGSLETLETVRQTTELPLLHKEFIVTPYQLLEGRVRGASAALILVYYFSETELRQILKNTKKIGMEAVVECSLEEELPRALAVNPDILMINNRAIAALPEEPLKTYQQGRVEVTLEWWERYPDLRKWKAQSGKLLISASCVNSARDTQVLSKIPCDAALIGNAAMTAPDRVKFLRALKNKSK